MIFMLGGNFSRRFFVWGMPMEDIRYKIIRSHRTTVAIQIVDGLVIVRCPYGVRDSWVYRQLQEKEDWIRKHLQLQQPVDKFSEQQLQDLKKQAGWPGLHRFWE